MHKIRILWYRGINVLDSAAEPRANATCDCRDFTHRCIAAKSFFFLAKVVEIEQSESGKKKETQDVSPSRSSHPHCRQALMVFISKNQAKDFAD